MLKTVCAIIIGLISFGCSHVNIMNTYKPATSELTDSTKLAFTMETTADSSTSGVTVYGEPYQLMVFVPYKIGFMSITLKELTLSGKNGAFIELPSETKYLQNIEDTYEGSIVLTFDIKKLEYQSYTLSGELVLERDTVLKSYPVEVVLDTDYREEQVNKLWEKLMGI